VFQIFCLISLLGYQKYICEKLAGIFLVSNIVAKCAEFVLLLAMKVSLMDLNPDTVYRIKVAAATESIVSENHYFIGPYSRVEEIRTLGELELII